MRIRLHVLALVVGAIALGGCSDEEPVGDVRPRTTPSAGSEPTPVTTPSPTPTQTATLTPAPAPEGEQGGGGDEVPGQGAGFSVGRDGDVYPDEIEMTAYLPVRLSLSNETTVPVRADLSSLGSGTLTVPAAGTREVEIAGPRPGRYEVGLGQGAATLVAVADGG